MIKEAENPSFYYHIIRPWLEEALAHSGNYVTVGQVFDALNMGTWTLYMVYGEDKWPIGFGIVELLNTANGTWLNVPFAYAKNGSYVEFFEHLCDLAYGRGMTGVKFVSGRAGFEKRAKEFGWKKGFTEWIVRDFR